MADSADPPAIDTTVPSSARITNYWLGGKDHYPVDREVGEAIARIHPDIVALARQDRAFIGRAVRFLARDAGVRQFLDIGTGLPTMDNTHQVAQRVAPDAKIVYVDNDPLVLAHARALLTSAPQGRTAYVDADLREPENVLHAARGTLDLSEPVAVMLIGVLQHIVDDDEATSIVRRLLAPLAPGSHFVLVHDTADFHGRRVLDAMDRFMQDGGLPICARDRRQMERLVEGLEILEPGIVSTSRWRMEINSPWGTPEQVAHYSVVARKP
ncbi:MULTISPECIES: SAM-dependent methyltransferase [Actinomadura]|uniref:SAM-dependent methyltransferase n=1 Tax=Actinomadura yumaensis TaxID=111807 RepID=A0ABW2CJY3_9ACTN|nr:SAM-dependent methyltransferase [Actinomadura sp. J1-007]MWK39871.1 SAM-dependent methyltransferase [Actinomadura sp. J1-007]